MKRAFPQFGAAVPPDTAASTHPPATDPRSAGATSFADDPIIDPAAIARRVVPLFKDPVQAMLDQLHDERAMLVDRRASASRTLAAAGQRIDRIDAALAALDTVPAPAPELVA